MRRIALLAIGMVSIAGCDQMGSSPGYNSGYSSGGSYGQTSQYRYGPSQYGYAQQPVYGSNQRPQYYTSGPQPAYYSNQYYDRPRY